MKDKIITLQTDLTQKNTSEVLLISQFSDDKNYKKSLPKLDQKLIDRIEKKSKRIGFKSEKGESVVIHDTDGLTTFDTLIVFGLGKKKEVTESYYKETLAKILREVTSMKYTTATLFIASDITLPPYSLGKAITEALYLSQYRFDTYKSKEEKEKQTTITEIKIYVGETQNSKLKTQIQEGIEFGKTVSEAVNFARDLVNEPGQYMNPQALVNRAREIAKNSNGAISVKILDEKECRKLGMGAYLAVAQGSEYKPQFIELSYRGNKGDKGNSGNRGNVGKRLCLIGKSITFDTGGLSLKPSKHMETMKLDMAGGAAVLGVFKVLGELGEYGKSGNIGEIWGILPACENMPSGRATRPGDIATALNGTSIEILNTDAEGRLALADALSYAEKYLKPDYIIDLATLTGAIMVALGPDITGLFANSEKLLQSIKKAADDEGEQLWPMPLHKPYAKKMKSDVADLKNITGMGYGGAVTAALFLQEFVKKAKWAHLDIAGSAFNEGGAEGTTPKGGTGWGVRTLVNLLYSGIQ